MTTSNAASDAPRAAVSPAPVGGGLGRGSLSATTTPHRQLKRGLDVAVCVVAAPLVLVVVVLIGVGIVISSPGNPFFVQRRVGRGGAIFPCVKFRTMYPGAVDRLHTDPDLFAEYIANDYKLSAHDDPRVFWFGRLLRRTFLDEVPQVLNVLLGHMSLVGPRPVVPEELAMYEQWQFAYLAMRPGITGVWQINGRNQVRYPERARMDAAYFEQWSFWTDVVILVKTIPVVLMPFGGR